MDKSEWGTYEQIVGTLKKADIVEIDRNIYKHFTMFWGINANNGRAICFHVYKDSEGGKKHMQYLDEVVGEHRCRINNLKMEANIRKLKERSKEAQIDEAKKGLDNVDFTSCSYNVLTNNCETYVTEWKYRAGFSKQVHILGVSFCILYVSVCNV